MKCETKKAYLSIAKAAAAIRGRQLSGVGYLRVYECPYCGAYHITSAKPYSASEAVERKESK